MCFHSSGAVGLLAGPIVGHTDSEFTIICICVSDKPQNYSLNVVGRGTFPFVSTEGSNLEFGTAVAKVTDPRPEWEYKYKIQRKGRDVRNALGSSLLPVYQILWDQSFVIAQAHFLAIG